MRTMLHYVAALLAYLALTAVPARADGISGTYVGKSSNSAFLVQIVQTNDGRLTGHYKQVTQQAGKMSETNASIAGASDGHTIALTLSPTELLAGSLSLSGTVEGPLLHATGGGYGSTISLNLTKSSENEFQAAIAELTRQAELFNSRTQIQDALPRIKSLTTQMGAFSKGLPGHLARFAPLEGQYKAITEKMRAGLARQRSIYCQNPSGYCEGQATASRAQVAVAIQQTGIQANQLHLSVQSNYNDFDTKAKVSEKLIADMIKLCQSANSNVNDEALLSRWHVACQQMILAVHDYQKHVAQLRDAFVQAERIWREEQPKQKGMVQSAFKTQ